MTNLIEAPLHLGGASAGEIARRVDFAEPRSSSE
jgi:hypothetical protein